LTHKFFLHGADAGHIF